MYPAPNNYHHQPTEEGCEICGFMRPDFPDDEGNVDRNSRGLRGIAEGGGSSIYSTIRQQEPRRYENQARSSLSIEGFDRVWNAGSASSSASDLPTLIDLNYLLYNFCYKYADNSDLYHPMSQQQPTGLAPISLQQPAASIDAQNNCAPLYGGRSKETLMASGTAASKEKKLSRLSLKKKRGGKWCGFCAKNGEEKDFVRSHALKNMETGKVQCPILRHHICERCGTTQDDAHTISHCPLVQGRVKSTALSVKCTQIKSNGTKRKNEADVYHVISSHPGLPEPS